MPRHKPELKQEVVRLRVEERKSFNEILSATGASRGSLSEWLKPYPLTDAEKKQHLSLRSRYAAPKKDRGLESRFHQMVAGSELTVQRKAKIAEAAVLFRLVLNGFTVYGSVFDGDQADWIVDVPEAGRIFKVQVRWATPMGHGLPVVKLCCSDGRRSLRRLREGEFDVLVGYDLFSDIAYVFTASEVAHLKSAVTVMPQSAEAWWKLRESCLQIPLLLTDE